jgi:PTH1 family peptidyl-tRNA hydrolase
MSFFGFIKSKAEERIDYLIVGLGNPDDEYLKTRHNVGWMVADKFSEVYSIALEKVSKYFGYFGIKQVNGVSVALLKPTTYMNRSGKSIAIVMEKYKIRPENLIVIVDEYNFPVGRIHIKSGGGDGGHNGLTSVINQLNDNNFLRLRCGIDKNFGPGELVDYVLSQFDEDEISILQEMINKSCQALVFLITNERSKALSFINSGKLWEDKSKDNQKNNIDNN